MTIKDRILSINQEDYFKKANLHIHSSFSDGEEDFDSLVESAKSLGLLNISITDHNTIKGYLNSKYKNDEILIKGIEFDCIMELCPFHILGYGVDIENPELLKLCAKNDFDTKNDLKRILLSRNPKKVIEAIHKAGGIAVLAHPCCYWTLSLDRFVKKLISYGLDGIETNYPYNRFRGVVKFHSRKIPFKIAKKYNLLTTGGLDNHKKL